MLNFTETENSPIACSVRPSVSNEDLNRLFEEAWPSDGDSESSVSGRNFEEVLRRSLTYVCAFYGEQLIGFVNLAWDGGVHAFVLDTVVHPDFQRRGIGKKLVSLAIAEAKGCDIEWIHVDFEPHLRSFYSECGFVKTEAGLIQLSD